LGEKLKTVAVLTHNHGNIQINPFLGHPKRVENKTNCGPVSRCNPNDSNVMKFIFIKRPVYYCTRRSLKKFLMIMKLTAFLLMIAFVQVSAKGYGQITLHEKNAPFEKVMTSIRKQTNYTIFYNERVKKGAITIDIDNAGIQETLDKCFQNLLITYKIVGNSIFIKEKEMDNPPDAIKIPEPAALSTTVSGRILNEFEKPIDGA
jgi:type II secretory pathway component GspD/PulD (secretin)